MTLLDAMDRDGAILFAVGSSQELVGAHGSAAGSETGVDYAKKNTWDERVRRIVRNFDQVKM